MKKLLFLLLLVGAGYAAWSTPSLRRQVEPSAQVVAIELQAATLARSRFLLQVDVSNPNLVPLPLGGVTCALRIGEEPAGEAKTDAGTTLAAGKATRVEVPVEVESSRLAALALQGLTRGAIRPYVADCTMRFTAAGAAVELPFTRRGQIDLVKRQLLREDGSPEGPVR